MQARLRLASLWTSQVLRSATDAGLRLFVVLVAAASDPGQRESAWHLVMALFMLPCLLLAPVNGALANSCRRGRLLLFASVWMLAVLLAYAVLGGGMAGAAAAVAGVALGSAIYGPTRFAMLPAAAQDTGWPLPRVTAVIESGAVLAMVAGMMGVGQLLALHSASSFDLGWPALPPALTLLLLMSVLSLLAAWPVDFKSDLRRAESPRQALRGFFADFRRIWRHPPARTALLGIAFLRGAVAVAVGALIAAVLAQEQGDAATSFTLLLAVALLAMGGAGLGSLLAGWAGGRARGQAASEGHAAALIPLGACGLALSMGWLACQTQVPLALCALIGLFGGLVNVPLLVAYQLALPADARGNGMSILSSAGYAAMTLLSLLMAGLSALRWLDAPGQLAATALLASLGAAAALVLAWRQGRWSRLRTS